MQLSDETALEIAARVERFVRESVVPFDSASGTYRSET